MDHRILPAKCVFSTKTGEMKKDMTTNPGKTRSGGNDVIPLALVSDIRDIIVSVKSDTYQYVNSSLVRMYWTIGKRINNEILHRKRAAYGSAIVVTLSRQLVMEFGRGFTEKNLRRMMQFADVFQDEEIVATLSRHLSWSHFILLLPLKDEMQRDFYATVGYQERWSVRALRDKIESMLYERTSISRKPIDTIRKEIQMLRNSGAMSENLVFREHYLLSFLGLRDDYSESELEDAILNELERFLLELGSGFTFIERQKRMIIDGEDHALDLLLFHRKLRRLVAVELKLGKFKAAYKGQMELYLRWLERYEMIDGENRPLGLVLCSEGAKETIELLQLDKAGIRVAEYTTELPEKALLKQKFRQAIDTAKQQMVLNKSKSAND